MAQTKDGALDRDTAKRVKKDGTSARISLPVRAGSR